MIFFVVLILISVIINLYNGDFVNVFFGLFIFVIVYLASLFWDSLGKYGNVILVIISVGLLLGLIVAMDKIEITPEKYQEVAEIKLLFPELREQIENAIEDGEISITEKREIDKKYQKMRKEKAINDIKK